MKIWKDGKVVAEARGAEAGKLFSAHKGGKDIRKWRPPSGKQPVPAASTPKYSLISEEEYKAAQQVPFAWTPPKLPSGKQPVDTEPAAAAARGKEIVFEFSKPISSKASTYVSKLVKLLGGKRSYIEDQTKLVVVM
jgi:hypothetical protein